MARPGGFEPPTCGLEGRRSIQLSYGRLFIELVGIKKSAMISRFLAYAKYTIKVLNFQRRIKCFFVIFFY